MVALKSAQTARFLAAPDARFEAFLLYGPEPGPVSARAEALARLLAERTQGEVVRLDDASLAERPDALTVEARTPAMFGGRKVVRVKAGARLDPAALEALLAGPLEAFLIAEAGALRPQARLRQVFEAAERAAAVPCYPPERGDLAALVEAELSRHRLALDEAARTLLLARLGADPDQVRAEIAKLALYAGDAVAVGEADVEAVVGDSSQAALDALAEAALSGNAAEALRQLDRLVAGGTGAQSALQAVARHLDRLYRLCAEAEGGGNVRALLARARPPLPFRQRDALLAQAQRWTRAAAAGALSAVRRATRDARLQPDLERPLAEQALLLLARRAPAKPQDSRRPDRTVQ